MSEHNERNLYNLSLFEHLLEACWGSDADTAIDNLIDAAAFIIMGSTPTREHALAEADKFADQMRVYIYDAFYDTRAAQQRAKQANDPMASWEILAAPDEAQRTGGNVIAFTPK